MGVSELEPRDLWDLSLLPALSDPSAPGLPPKTLASLLAFPVVAGLIAPGELSVPQGPLLGVLDVREAVGEANRVQQRQQQSTHSQQPWQQQRQRHPAIGQQQYGASRVLQQLQEAAVVAVSGRGAVRLRDVRSAAVTLAARLPPPVQGSSPEAAAAAEAAAVALEGEAAAGACSALYLPQALRGAFDLSRMLPAIQWRVVDDVYVTAAPGMDV